MIRVRFAPSPTGYLHIGGARTALFNWMYAQAQDGQFILRIEDTDRVRSKKEFLDEILDSMQWLGLNWDELYRQSERFDIYRKHAESLLNSGKAYKDGEAIILSMPKREVIVHDLTRGEIKFDTKTLKDEVLIKSDGSPTYSFACVVDDALMKISHVIRGEDHISNTPKQIIIYEALGFKIPKFAHLPLIMGADGGRLSKRTGAVAVSDYKKMGFVPEGLVNYLMLLGWSPGGDKEVVKIKDAAKKFSIKKVNRTPAEFSLDKLKWINGQHIKKMETSKVVDMLIPFLEAKGYISGDFDRKALKSIVQLYQARMPTLVDFTERASYIFLDDITVDSKLRRQYLKKDNSRAFSLLAKRLEKLEVFDAKTTEEEFRALVKELGIQASDLVHPVRVAITGQTVGIGLFDTMAVLGREKTVKRLKSAYK